MSDAAAGFENRDGQSPDMVQFSDPNLRAQVARFTRFVIVGGFATALMYALLLVGVEGLGMTPVPASVVAYGLSAIANYALNRRLTFRSTQRHRVALPRFAAVSGAGLIINTLIMYVGTTMMNGHYLVVQILATAVVLLWNYLGSYLWTFHQPSGR
ncbi:MAG: GtrA family protein [Pseudomonadota bacterium]|nr:GtrA family protein [Pseudomonadota bacterium]